MNKKRLLFFAVALSTTLLTTSCIGKLFNQEPEVEYIPFQETDDGRWGMISPDGKVLFSEEFEEEPTWAYDGRFFVKNNEGFYEMYETSDHPKKIGNEYAYVSPFCDGLAVVTEKDSPISIINRNGKTVKLLDKIDGKDVERITPNLGGPHIFQTTDSLCGAIDQKGNCIIPAKYYYLSYIDDDKYIAIKDSYRKQLQDLEFDNVKMSIITKDKVLFEFDIRKYIDFGIHGEYLSVSVLKNDEPCWGIIDMKGEYVVKPSTKIKDIPEIDASGKYFIYSDGDSYGLMSIDGEIIIRAKYQKLHFWNDKVLVAIDDDDEYQLIDFAGEKIGNDTYQNLFSVSDKYLLAEVSDNEYEIISPKGKRVKNTPSIADFGTTIGNRTIESDFVDTPKILKSLQIQPNGFLGITDSTATTDVLRIAGLSTDPSIYIGDMEITIEKDPSIELNIIYLDPISSFSYDYNYNYSAKWTNTTPAFFGINFFNEGKLEGKSAAIYKSLIAEFKKSGSIEEQEDDHTILSLQNGWKVLIHKDDEAVSALWAKSFFFNLLIDKLIEEAVEAPVEELDTTYADDWY